ncbi:Stk1 family PASTA domain-containing Ser/Thr kinase [Yinghuangia sp. ASG 101]|uniref:Stk1 family PASTA domain-containing Ser/Thr kinase n=1 Tax=Yinghuangia sp. ASG 101 TaxID=2896848 RepID=UPI001E4BFFBA|nr:Stk1 family PASTA domain-containing Ser/Thr kinase [Yinghuangia sp. ASG 101]UGQ15565.1 Stk1 family PASTA domain-containing Ser/Thr kinase [Yinghuangia sp. ASG 101]
MSMDDPLVGSVLDGRYRVQARIAAGGMATVYRALDSRLDRTVAVKVMHPALAADASFTDRFIREAKAAARLSHPNVVGVFDQGHDGDVAFLAMEYVEGRTLRELLQDLGTLTPREAFGVLEPTLAALGAAHRAGFVHRDVKPENVLISDDGGIKVADFGLARATASTASAATGKVLVGTVAYLAPEQIERGTASPTSDVYAAGIMLYEMLTGRPPYPGRSAVEIIYKHVHEDVPPPSRTIPGLPAALDTVVAKATARDPKQRPADAEELLALVRATRQREMSEADLDFGADQRVLPPPVPEYGESPEYAAAGAYPGFADDAPAKAHAPLEIGPLGLATESVLDEHPHAAYHGGGPEDPDGSFVADADPRRRGPSLGMIAFLVVIVVAATIGIVAWQMGSEKSVKIPAVIQVAASEAQKRLTDDGFKVDVKESYSETVPRDQVIATDPMPGKSLDKGSIVTMTVSLGPERLAVPKLAGQTVDQAKQALQGAGLAVGDVTQQDSGQPVGQVIGTSPQVGTMLARDTAVDLVVSQGTPVPVPSVVGLTEAEARDAVTASGLQLVVDPTPVFSADVPAGKVAAQSPADGKLHPGGPVTVAMSKGPDLVLVPKVDGMSEGDARKTLEAAGFKVSVNTVFPLGPKNVTSMSPGGNNMAPRGSTVTINVF